MLMTTDEIIKALEYTIKKHKRDIVGVGETNVVALAKDCLSHIRKLEDKIKDLEG